MPGTPVAVLSAVTLVAALGLAGCADSDRSAAALSQRPTVETSRTAAPSAAPLPSSDALAGVLYGLADTSIPAEQKLRFVQFSTIADQAASTSFGDALQANGFAPLTIQATDLAWAGEPGHVTAVVTIGSPNPTVAAFTFPMEFAPMGTTWQLSRRTADQLLPVVGAPQPPG